MSKDKTPVTAPAEAPQTGEESVADQLQANQILQAQNEALAGELEFLRQELLQEREQRLIMEAAISKLTRRVESANTNSVTFEEGKRPELTRPTFEVDGVKYRFKFARFTLFGQSILASEAVRDEALCSRIVGEYPGQVETVTE